MKNTATTSSECPDFIMNESWRCFKWRCFHKSTNVQKTVTLCPPFWPSVKYLEVTLNSSWPVRDVSWGAWWVFNRPSARRTHGSCLKASKEKPWTEQPEVTRGHWRSQGGLGAEAIQRLQGWNLHFPHQKNDPFPIFPRSNSAIQLKCTRK